MTDSPIITIEEAPPTFEFGDATVKLGDVEYRLLYGPQNEKGERKTVGFIDISHESQIEDLLEYADAHMPKDGA